MAPLTITDLVVTRGRGAGAVRILDGIDLALPAHAFVAVTGPSGAGKTTLLHAMAGLLTPSAGRICWGDTDIGALDEASRDRWRRIHVGLVFQDFQLVPELDIRSNILLPFRFDRWRLTAAEDARAEALAQQVGLGDLTRRAGVLSRGEQQRTAIARALVRKPAMILADEPTASLDAETGAAAAELLIGSARAVGASLLVVSHDRALLRRADRIFQLEAGVLSPAAETPA